MAARTPATPGAPASSATLAVSVARLTCACTPGKRSRTRSIREAQAAQVMPVMARSSVVGDSMASIARGATRVLPMVDAGFISPLYTQVGYMALTHRASWERPSPQHSPRFVGRGSRLLLAFELREQDDVANRWGIGQQHHQPVDADAFARGRRQAVF